MYTNVVILEGIDLQFEERLRQFQNGFRYLSNPDDAFGFLATALPTNNDVQFDRVFHDREIAPSLNENWHGVYARRHPNPDTNLDTFLKNHSLPWRPKPRAARADSDQFFSNRYAASGRSHSKTNLHKEINCAGLVELGLMSSRFYETDDTFARYVSPYLLVATFANLITQIHRVRLHADRPATPYTIRALMHSKGSPRTFGRPGAQFGYDWGTLYPGTIKFPCYSLGDVSDATELLNLFHLDLHHQFGRSLDTEKTYLGIKDWEPHE